MNEEDKRELIRKLHTLQDYYIEDGYQGFAGVIHETINQLEKQDKIIHEMAEYLEDETTIDDFCNKENCYADNYINGHCQKCLNCIIEYFTKKVGE